jgi:hypothetical protein
MPLARNAQSVLPSNRLRINTRVILYEANWSVLLTLHFKIKHVASKIIYFVKVLFSELNR